ncbi:MAG: hypothetical protein QME52_07615 [Bacteroidota bacterium]|nr:hypothetical protein [Bacteroidota bacterium]
MLGNNISHYRIIEKLGEVPIRLDLASAAKLSPFVGLRIPPILSLSKDGGSSEEKTL